VTAPLSATRQSLGPFVYTRIIDGLGNQLFQYAAGRALADRLGAELLFDCGWFKSNTGRAFELDAFAIDAVRDWDVRSVKSRWIKIPTRPGKRLTAAIHNRLPNRVDIHGRAYKVFDEKRIYRYDPYFQELSGSIYLTGWWQSPRYFESSSDAIRAELQFGPLAHDAQPWLERIRRANAVSLHVRRGDYLLSQDRWTCSKSYYDKAIEFFRSKIGDVQFFVFSDDPAWCRESFAASDVTVVETEQSSAVGDLALMAACRHHIIANSSFSWWGAWLSDAPDQIVVAPQYWVVDLPTSDDLVARRWANFYRF
jgi:hypothetical protein